MSRILTVAQTAEKLQLSEEVIREYLRAGKIPGRKIGKSWRVVESDLEHWVSAGQSERIKQIESVRGILKKYPGTLTSEEFMAEKRAEVDEEERRYEERAARNARIDEGRHDG